MCKQKYYNQVTKIYEKIVKEKEFNITFSELANQLINKNDNEIIIINEVSKLLAKNGYYIISIDPLKIKHK